MAATAVLDIGKTNLKVVLFDAEGAVLRETSAPNAPLPGPPYLHADVDSTWRFILAGLAEAAKSHEIACIVPTAHGACAACISETGLALPILDYEDKGPEEIEIDYAKIRPHFLESLSPPAAGGLNVGRQIAYQKWRFPDAFANTRHILFHPQYWSWRLTGVATTEYTSLGCHTDLAAPMRGPYSSLVGALGIGQLFPPIRPAYDVLGPITPEVAAATGLAPATPVLSGIHDSNASLLPHLLNRPPPFTVVSTGTWAILMSVGYTRKRIDEASDLYANINVFGDAVLCARFMGGREYAIISGGDTASPDLAALQRIIGSGALALPSFTGQGGPYALRKGEMRGDTPPADRSALATLHVALMTDDLLTRLEATTGDLVIEGSFGKNAAFCGVLAALRPSQAVVVPADQSGTARGAALLAHWPRPPKRALEHQAEPLALPGLTAYRQAWRRDLA